MNENSHQLEVLIQTNSLNKKCILHLNLPDSNARPNSNSERHTLTFFYPCMSVSSRKVICTDSNLLLHAVCVGAGAQTL